MARKPVVLISEAYYKRGAHAFDIVEDIEFHTAPADEESLAAMVRIHKPAAVVVGPEPYTGTLYRAMEQGTLLARFGVGCDGIEFDLAKQNGIRVSNTPGVLETTVAEFTLFLAGELLRRPGLSCRELREGEWAPYLGRDLRGKTWAILGLGSIGSELSKIVAFGFGVHVTALKRNLSGAETVKRRTGAARLTTSLHDAISDADIISVHLPSNSDTYHLVNKGFFKRVKRGALLVNTARGALVDETALYDALSEGRLGGAALDVFEQEPYRPVDPGKDLRDLSNLIMTPHIGSNAEECTLRMAERVIRNLRLAIAGQYEKMDIVTGS